MIILAIISNGLLVNYANKFFTFLVSENRKGYVQTAVVKNLNDSYEWGTPDGVSYWSVLRPHSLFGSHVFKHIYLNARYQFLITLKEHASFLITGLIIIEMALNIQGHLGYEMLQNILYKEYDVVVSIILGIFFIVKATEIVVDGWFYIESKKYENKT
jgi:ABC-type transport system involved in multi-copper enzyme maturation permease subunit